MFDAAALWKYLTVWGTIIGSGFGLPVPEEIPVVLGGVWVGSSADGGPPPEGVSPEDANTSGGMLYWWIMLPGTILAVVIGDSVLYFGGRYLGPRLLRNAWFQRKIMPPATFAKIEDNFKKRGVMILLAARFTPGVRMPVFLAAGMLRMPLSRFLLADGLYAIPGVNLLFWLGYAFTWQFLAALKAVEQYRPLVIVAVLAAIGGIVLYKLLANRKLSTGDMEDVSGLAKPVGAVTHAIEQGIEKGFEKVVDVVTHPLGHKPRSPSDPALTPVPPAPTPPPVGDTPAPAK